MKTGIVLKAFPFAFDGINTTLLAAGVTFPVAGHAVPDSIFDGLEAAGFVEVDDAGAESSDASLNRRLIETIDRRLQEASDEDLKAIIARSGREWTGNLTHAPMVAAAKAQLAAEAEGVTPIFARRAEETPVAEPEDKPEPAAGETTSEKPAAGENKATNQFGDPIPGAAPSPSDNIDGLKKDELEKLAAERGVDISAAKTKPEILAALKAAQA